MDLSKYSEDGTVPSGSFQVEMSISGLRGNMKRFLRTRSISLWAPALVVLSFLVFGVTAGEDSDPVEVRCTWCPPSYGAPVEHYVLEVHSEDIVSDVFDDLADTFKVLYLKFGIEYKARIAAVDSLGRQGPWSNWARYDPDEHSDLSGFVN